jgi:hypothetical protein
VIAFSRSSKLLSLRSLLLVEEEQREDEEEEKDTGSEVDEEACFKDTSIATAARALFPSIFLALSLEAPGAFKELNIGGERTSRE